MNETKPPQDMLGRGELTPVAEAQRIIQEQLAPVRVETERIPLGQANDRILASDILAPEDLPPAPRSTMDGYAVRSGDTFGASESMPAYLSITGEVLMGRPPTAGLSKGCCQKIPTGGLLPPGADAVVMLEHTVPVDETMIEVVKGVGSGTNLIQAGEDLAKGQRAVARGKLLRPQEIGLLAGIGITELEVYRRLKVAICSTGDEIIPHDQVPQPGQIRNINSLVLTSLVSRLGTTPIDYGIISDERDHFLPIIRKGVEECDMVLFSGGSSVGVRDLGEQVIEEIGPPGILVHGVKLKPGKPVLIGMAGTTPVFGLPGHPVSAMVCFDYFVKPAIHLLSGRSPSDIPPAPYVMARLSRNINSAPGRLDLVRVQLQPGDSVLMATPILGKSGSISTLSRADGYFEIDEDSQGVEVDTIVKVYLYQ